MKTMSDVVKNLQGKSPEQQARIIAKFMADEQRRKQTEAYRDGVRNRIFAGCKKLNKSQQDAYLYEYLDANAGYINDWLLRNNQDLAKTDTKSDAKSDA